MLRTCTAPEYTHTITQSYPRPYVQKRKGKKKNIYKKLALRDKSAQIGANTGATIAQ